MHKTQEEHTRTHSHTVAQCTTLLCATSSQAAEPESGLPSASPLPTLPTYVELEPFLNYLQIFIVLLFSHPKTLQAHGFSLIFPLIVWATNLRHAPPRPCCDLEWAHQLRIEILCVNSMRKNVITEM